MICGEAGNETESKMENLILLALIAAASSSPELGWPRRRVRTAKGAKVVELAAAAAAAAAAVVVVVTKKLMGALDHGGSSFP